MTEPEQVDWNELLLYVTGTNVVTLTVFLVIGGGFLYTDITGKPKWMMKQKVQIGKNQPVEIDSLKRALPTIGFNLLLILASSSKLYFLQKWRGCDLSLSLPTISQLIVGVTVSILAREIAFYYIHRVLHHPLLYTRIHKKHHEWTAPVSIIAIYAHPLEHILCNMLPVALGPLIIGANMITTWIWTATVLITTLCHHSGYNVPLCPALFHDSHHSKSNENYGIFGLCDWLHGTDSESHGTSNGSQTLRQYHKPVKKD